MAKDQVPTMLAQILTTKRAHGSAGDTQFRTWLMAALRNMKVEPKVLAENIVVTVSDSGEDSKILFSCHIDTVHSAEVSDGSRQKLAYDKGFGHLFLDTSSKGHGTCLGADDGAGIYVLMRMIEARVKGTYVFHVGEERGGIGSNNMRSKHQDFLKKFSHAIAFDRAGTDDVVYVQGGTSCASIECAEALSQALNELNSEFTFKPSDRGTFTDTKVYAGTIVECLNVSVGYLNQHSQDESLDVAFLEDLVDACINLDWEALPKKRIPGVSGFYDSNKNKTHDLGGFPIGSNSSFRMYPDTEPFMKKSPQVPVLQELEDLTFTELQEIAHDDPDMIVRAYIMLRAKVHGLEVRVESLEDALN